MSDITRIITEALNKMMPEITKVIVSEIEKKNAPKPTYENRVQPLMECDTAEWHTITRNERGKLRSRPADTATRRPSPTRSPIRRAPERRSPIRRALDRRLSPRSHDPYRRPPMRRPSPEHRGTVTQHTNGERRPYKKQYNSTQTRTNRERTLRRDTRTQQQAEHWDVRRANNYGNKVRMNQRRSNKKQQLPVPPSEFARIKDDMYRVVHNVQLAHHADLWRAGNPVRALTEGVRRLVDNLRTPKSNKKIVDKLKEEGERFLEIIQVTMLQHLRESHHTSDAELRNTKPPQGEDEETITKQATALLRKNYGCKLTSDDINCHLENACTLLFYDEREDMMLRRDTITTATTAAPGTSVWVSNEDESNDDEEGQTQALDGATSQRNAHIETSHQASGRETETENIQLPKRITRSQRMSAQQTSTAHRGEGLVDHLTKNQ